MPAVVLVTEAFAAVARASARARGLPDLPIVVFPADLDEWDHERVARAFATHWPAIRAGLVRR